MVGDEVFVVLALGGEGAVGVGYCAGVALFFGGYLGGGCSGDGGGGGGCLAALLEVVAEVFEEVLGLGALGVVGEGVGSVPGFVLGLLGGGLGLHAGELVALFFAAYAAADCSGGG